jgi:aryl-alcohol dehydrogenase-like predicted oxidoreductase
MGSQCVFNRRFSAREIFATHPYPARIKGGACESFRNAVWDAKFITSKHQDKKGISLSEAAYRWLQHHSGLQLGDGIIIGASTVDQLENNLKEKWVTCLSL